MKISAVIITLNEEKYIGRCIESLRGVADEILVLDSFSTDETEAICRGLGVRFEQHPFDGYISQKNRAMAMASHDWILSLDGDEALSDELKKSIEDRKSKIESLSQLDWDRKSRIENQPDTVSGFIFNRRNNYCGRWMRFTTWYPDRKLRLFYRPDASWAGYDPHDHVILTKPGRVKFLHGDLLHWAVDSPEEYRQKCDHFARITAKAYVELGKKAGIFTPAIHGAWRWLHEFIWRVGFLDGAAGMQIARYNAMNAFRKYKYLRKLNNGKDI